MGDVGQPPQMGTRGLPMRGAGAPNPCPEDEPEEFYNASDAESMEEAIGA
jgi:hypothetical protein